MANIIRSSREEEEYPSSDGLPMAETDIHRKNLLDLTESLALFYAEKPDVYVSGNMLMYYVRGDKHKHVAPDVFVVHGVEKRLRDNYLVWVEGKAPDFVIELTSSSTAGEDQNKKFKLYRDVLKVKEYFLFDPKNEYLKPPLQGYRLSRGHYVQIRPVKGRLPSRVLGLNLERSGEQLRLFDPISQRWIPTRVEKYQEAEQKYQEAEQKCQEAEQKCQEAEQKCQEAELELKELRREIKLLKDSRKNS